MYPSTPRPVEPSIPHAFDAPPPSAASSPRGMVVFFITLLFVSLALSMAAFHQLEAQAIELRGHKAATIDCETALDQCVAVANHCTPSIP